MSSKEDSDSGSGSYEDGSHNSVSVGEVELAEKKPVKEYKMEGSTVTYYDNIM
jgi:hypothetical protein